MAESEAGESELESLRQRVDLLERENQRLREKLEPIFGADNPCFDPAIFRRVLSTRVLMLMLPMFLMPLLPMFLAISRSVVPRWYLGGVPVLDVMGHASGYKGLGLGLVAYGGVGVGVVACGGGAIGVIACGGGAVGLVAVGGGALGVVAIGAGALGVVALGAGAAGYYALGQQAVGKYILCMRRQDPEAIEFFTRFIPALRRALTTAMPVIPLKSGTRDTQEG